MREAKPAVEGEPVGGLELIFKEDGFHVAPYDLALRRGGNSAVPGGNAEDLVIALPEDLKARAKYVTLFGDGGGDDATEVV